MSAPTSRRTTVICAAFLALLGCSKTQDTAPETRVFGEPPVIQSVGSDPDPVTVASCDFTDIFLINRGFCSSFPTLIGPVTVEARYTEVILEARVTDPDDPAPPATGTDILLVSASYVLDSGSGTPSENTIVLFDDGAQIAFPFTQKDVGTLQNCPACTPNAICTEATYNVTSNDPTAADHDYTRGFAFAPAGSGIPANKDGLYRDCIAKGNHQASQIVADSSAAQIEFRFEAVDKNGNLTESPTRPPATIGTAALTCTGDPCACCLLLNDTNPADPIANGGCFGHPGLMFDPGTFCRQTGNQVPASLLNMPCMTDADCNNVAGSCRQTALGRNCPNGYCQSSLCLF
ncbi:MAG TPA: hypothetical protein VFG08_06200 [Candidatus Polarisedimenticolia bacterium]|nr:hypothetical protein [Candidatus Polarisedimenticolia bacterium]